MSVSSTAAPPPPPDGIGGSGGTPGQQTGGADLGSGLLILAALGAAYGSRKLWIFSQARKLES